jgi:hypothetical protein
MHLDTPNALLLLDSFGRDAYKTILSVWDSQRPATRTSPDSGRQLVVGRMRASNLYVTGRRDIYLKDDNLYLRR